MLWPMIGQPKIPTIFLQIEKLVKFLKIGPSDDFSSVDLNNK